MNIDPLINLHVRYLQKPMLGLVTSQSLLRKCYELHAKLTYRPLKGCDLEWVEVAGVRTLKITPPDVPPSATKLLYLHGGGFTVGSPTTHKWLAARLAHAAGVEVWIPDYALAPEHPFPEAHNQVEAIFDALSQTGPVYVAGDSAGGQLAMALLPTGRRPQALALLSPLCRVQPMNGEDGLDFSTEMLIHPAWAKRVYAAVLPKGQPDDPRLNPLAHIGPDGPDGPDGPPILIHVSKEEALASEAQDIADALPQAAVEWEDNQPHVWQLHAGLSAAADTSLKRLGTFLRDNG